MIYHQKRAVNIIVKNQNISVYSDGKPLSKVLDP